MHSFVSIESFKNLIPKYNTFFFDLWGTIYDGNTIFPSFTVILNELRRNSKTVKFLSNSPRLSKVSWARLADCGLEVDVHEITTSGEYFAYLLATSDYGSRKFFLVGDDETVLDGLGVNVVSSISDADYLLIALCLQTRSLGKWEHIIKDAVLKGVPAVCVNPDLEVLHGREKVYTPGYFAMEYKNLGGEVIYFGKPYKDIYDFVLSGCDSLRNVLAVGDSIMTDIKGACNAKIDSLWVLGDGIHKEVKVSDKMQILSLCQQYKCYPRYIMDKLKLD